MLAEAENIRVVPRDGRVVIDAGTKRPARKRALAVCRRYGVDR